MKTLVKVAKNKGMKLECDDCHRDESAGRWELTAGAHERFERMLSLTR
jgi:hypothetical protein